MLDCIQDYIAGYSTRVFVRNIHCRCNHRATAGFKWRTVSCCPTGPQTWGPRQKSEGAFSAATFILLDRTVVVYNPLDLNGCYIKPAEARRDGRTRSNVAHEFSHIVLGHQVREVQKIAGHSFFTCNAEQEAEANWLAACILLPRLLLLAAAYRDETDDDIARNHNVTKQMAAFHMNASGARMQVARSRARRPQGE